MPVIAGIAYERHGGGRSNHRRPPLLLIHGAGATRFDWPASIRRMAGIEVLAIDLPGHGDSPGVSRDKIEAYRDSVVDFMDTLHLERGTWVGHSMGSAIALSAALDRRERVAALVLIGSGARLRVHPAILGLTQDPAGLPEAMDLFASGCFDSASPPRMIEEWKTRLAKGQGLPDDLRACNAFDVMDRLSEVTCPTLVVCGEDDRMTPPKYGRFLAEGISGAELRMIPGAGHMVMMEKPGPVAEEVQAFLERTPAHPSPWQGEG